MSGLKILVQIQTGITLLIHAFCTNNWPTRLSPCSASYPSITWVDTPEKLLIPWDFPWPGSATVAFFEAFQLPDWSEPQPPTPCLYTLLPTFPRGVQKTKKYSRSLIFYFSRWRENSFTKHIPWKDIFLFLIHSINSISISLLIHPKSKKKYFSYFVS